MDSATAGMLLSAGGALISALVWRSVQQVDAQLGRLTDKVAELAEHRADHAARLDSVEGRLARLETLTFNRKDASHG